MVNNIIDRFKPKSKEQRPVNLISLLHTYIRTLFVRKGLYMNSTKVTIMSP